MATTTATPSGDRVTSRAARPAREKRLCALVEANLDFVARSLRNLGVPEAEIDDAVQRTFLVVSRRLDDIREGAERAFLFKAALHDAAHVRRTLARRKEVSEEMAPDRSDDLRSPDALADQKRARQLLDRVLATMDLDLRSVFVLYEIEELTMTEIAHVLELPTGTVASRLRRAREDFRIRVRRLSEEVRP